MSHNPISSCRKYTNDEKSSLTYTRNLEVLVENSPIVAHIKKMNIFNFAYKIVHCLSSQILYI